MFQREITLNQFLLGYLNQVLADIPADRITERDANGGHPPVWILGHLAIVGEMGQMLLGAELQHPEWIAMFGPGSSDEVPNASDFTKDGLAKSICETYPKTCELLLKAPQQRLDSPHELALLEGTPIATVADLESHLLTTHFSFHLAQLSAWRRADGKGPII